MFIQPLDKILRNAKKYVAQKEEMYGVHLKDILTAILNVHQFLQLKNGLEATVQNSDFVIFKNGEINQHFNSMGVFLGLLGMKMCPFNQYVYGFQMKLDGRDGLSGLNLKCKNIYNSNENSIVNVKDNGRGMWFPGKTSSYFAVGFAIQNIGFVGFVPGLRMQFAMPPVITGVQFNYMVPPNFNSVPEVIDIVVVVNNGKVGMNKIIQFNKERQYQRIWQNAQSQLTGITLSKLFSQSYSVKSTLSIPILSSSNTNTQKSQIQIVNKTETIKSFSFGTIERVKIGQKQRDEILVQACTKKTIKQIVYTGQADIPYIVSIQYTNGVRIQTDTINGYYRGVVTGSVETVINQQTIC